MIRNTYTTLTQFVDEQLTKFKIPNNEKNQNKLRVKFTRTLKKLGLWDNAETKLIGRKRTKVFTAHELYHLYQVVEPYLVKKSPVISIEDLEEFRNKHKKNIEDIRNMTQEQLEMERESEWYVPPKVTREEKIELMVTAIFEEFFEPLDEEQWNNDIATFYYTDVSEQDSVECFLAGKRLNSKLSSYVKRRKDK